MLSFLVLITINRSWTRSLAAMLRVRNAAFGWVTSGTLVMLALMLFVPPVRRLFHFAPVHLADLGLSALAAPASLIWFEALKRIAPRTASGHPG